jgi:hypothetical protein
MYYLFCQVYRCDGSCVYGDEKHAERVEGLLEEFDRTRERVLATAERAVEEANRILALEHRDPTNALSAGELEEANAKREFVKEDCETMPLPDLADRARAALAAGDKRLIVLEQLLVPCVAARLLHRGPRRAPGPLREITFLLQIRRLFEWAIVDLNH